ncbi:hypothetical protein ACVWYN_003351 [Pedobacter sp. UYP24]
MDTVKSINIKVFWISLDPSQSSEMAKALLLLKKTKNRIMKNKLIIVLCVLLIPLLSLAQSTNKAAPGFFVIKSTPYSKEIVTRNMMIDASEIADLRVLRIQEAEKRFGKLKETSVIAELTLKRGIKISTLREFYNKHNIQGNKRNLPFVINGQDIKDTTNLVISENSLKVLKIRTDSIQIMSAAHLKHLASIKNKKQILTN